MPKVKFDYAYLLDWLESYTDFNALEKEAKTVFKGINEKNMFKKAHKILAFVDKIVTLIERAAIEFSNLENVDEPTGKKKLDLAVKFLDDKIKLPFYLEFFDDNVIRWMLSTAVAALNTHVGDSWEEKVEV
jgi:hypothetical protein